MTHTPPPDLRYIVEVQTRYHGHLASYPFSTLEAAKQMVDLLNQGIFPPKNITGGVYINIMDTHGPQNDDWLTEGGTTDTTTLPWDGKKVS